jgi:hypothetical protein
MKRTALAIVANLSLLAGCTPPPRPTPASLATAHADVARLRAAAEAWTRAKHRCPTMAELTGADAKLHGTDPWKHAYVLICPGQNGRAADAVSRGPDGGLATTDDIRSWDQR